jgi:sugar lactone lactonase YvrE
MSTRNPSPKRNRPRVKSQTVFRCLQGNGIGPAARFVFPLALALDDVGNLYVADIRDQTIRKIDLGSTQVTVLASAAAQPGSTDGPAKAARFRAPAGLAYEAGQLFVADAANYTIRKIVLQTGEVTTLAGTVGQSGQKDGIGSQAVFSSPQAMVADGAGHLFVGEGDYGTLRRVDIASASVSTVTAYAIATAGETSLLGAGSGNFPSGLAYDGADGLFVAEAAKHVVRKIDLQTGAVTTVVGVLGRPGVLLGDLPGQLTAPTGLAFVAPHRLYITDNQENAVLMTEF